MAVPAVLAYHGFTEAPRPDPHHLFVSRQNLRSQLEALRRWGFEALDLDGYLAALASRSARRKVLITVDDGFRSVAEIGAEEFARAGVPWVLFVPPGDLGQPAPWLDAEAGEDLLRADELRELRSYGAEIGVHAYTHEELVGRSPAELEHHTAEARTALTDAIGESPRSFCYPYGTFDEAARRAVASAGYEVGFTLYEDAGRFAVSRSDVKPADSLVSLRLKLVPNYRRWWRLLGAGPVRSGINRGAALLGRRGGA